VAIVLTSLVATIGAVVAPVASSPEARPSRPRGRTTKGSGTPPSARSAAMSPPAATTGASTPTVWICGAYCWVA